MLDQESDFYLISLNILITCLLVISMDILGRSFKFITFRSQRVKNPCLSPNPDGAHWYLFLYYELQKFTVSEYNCDDLLSHYKS